MNRLRVTEEESDEAFPFFEPPTPTSKLTPAVVKLVRTAMQQGHYAHSAARFAGLSYETLAKYMRQGAEDRALDKETPYTILLDQMDEGEQDAEAFLTSCAMKGAVKDGRLALEILGRKHPERWGRKDFRQTTGTIDVQVEIKRLMQADTSQEILIGPDSRPYNPDAPAPNGDGVPTGSVRELPPGPGREPPGGRGTYPPDGPPAAAGQGRTLDID